MWAWLLVILGFLLFRILGTSTHHAGKILLSVDLGPGPRFDTVGYRACTSDMVTKSLFRGHQ